MKFMHESSNTIPGTWANQSTTAQQQAACSVFSFYDLSQLFN
jgi:hypothetical protein